MLAYFTPTTTRTFVATLRDMSMRQTWCPMIILKSTVMPREPTRLVKEGGGRSKDSVELTVLVPTHRRPHALLALELWSANSDHQHRAFPAVKTPAK